MKQWVRWQDWVALLVGAYAALSPIWTDTNTDATRTMITLGAVTVLVSLWSLAMPKDQISEYAHAVLGVLFFIAPWVMGFSDINGMAYTAWAAGVITFAMSALVIPELYRSHHPALH